MKPQTLGESKITRVELKNIIPPAAIQEAMEKQIERQNAREEKQFSVQKAKRSL